MYKIGLKFLHFLQPEMAHYLAIKVLKMNKRKKFHFVSPRLETTISGIKLPHPLGLAAGFDKNGEVIQATFNYGASFTEIGAVTPLPQKGNPKPRMFRLNEDRALINRLGFNNEGVNLVVRRISKGRQNGVVGINIGANRNSLDVIADYLRVLECCAKNVDFATINISSPNTPKLRDLQEPEALNKLLSAINEKNNLLPVKLKIFLKIDPDLTLEQLKSVIEIAIKHDISGFIATNTTTGRPRVVSKYKEELGGLSGNPLFALSTKKLAQIFHMTEGKYPIIGVGGIDTAEDAYEKIKAGACALQIYTAIGYRGIGLIQEIIRALDLLLKNDGFCNISSAVGIENKKWLA